MSRSLSVTEHKHTKILTYTKELLSLIGPFGLMRGELIKSAKMSV